MGKTIIGYIYKDGIIDTQTALEMGLDSNDFIESKSATTQDSTKTTIQPIYYDDSPEAHEILRHTRRTDAW